MNTEWFRKRSDARATYAARAMGILFMFKAVGPVIHRDDIPTVAAILDVGPDAMPLLFEPTTLEWERAP